MIRIKRVLEKADAKDGYRVLIDRLWPRGMKKEAAKIDMWMKDVAPSDALRTSFHHEAMKWPDFEKKYQAELKKKKRVDCGIEKTGEGARHADASLWRARPGTQPSRSYCGSAEQRITPKKRSGPHYETIAQ